MNIDQTGVVFVFRANYTIEKIKRAKQVFIYGKDKKHAFTTILSGFCKGNVLSIQSVWKKATIISLPIKNAFQKVFAADHLFTFN